MSREKLKVMIKSKEMQIEMVPCPVCGNPMPKKRMKLGYNYCINCSTEGKKVCIVEGTQEGDGTQSEVIILSSQEAQAYKGYKDTGFALDSVEEETLLNNRTYEEQEEVEDLLRRKDLELLEAEDLYGFDRNSDPVNKLLDEEFETVYIEED